MQIPRFSAVKFEIDHQPRQFSTKAYQQWKAGLDKAITQLSPTLEKDDFFRNHPIQVNLYPYADMSPWPSLNGVRAWVRLYTPGNGKLALSLEESTYIQRDFFPARVLKSLSGSINHLRQTGSLLQSGQTFATQLRDRFQRPAERLFQQAIQNPLMALKEAIQKHPHWYVFDQDGMGLA